MKNIHRQGDVLLIPTDTVSNNVTQGKAVLALGEVSGHSHRMENVGFVQGTDGLAQELILEKPSQLVHEEHDAQEIPAGKYRVVIQRRMDALGAVQQVMD